MHTMHNESAYALRAIRAGPRGYVIKKTGGTGVVNAIKGVLRRTDSSKLASTGFLVDRKWNDQFG
jgi:DNA-binding NarL/FixJ family response regulator